MFTERYKSFNIFNPAKSKLFSGSYVLSPQNPDYDKLGRLYLIMEFSLDNNLASKISEIILEVLQKEYYRLEDVFREELILSNFEKTLNKTNQALSALASQGYTDWINNTHIAIAVLKHNKIHFAITGDPKIFLVRGNNFISINQGSGSQTPSPMKAFTNITSGTLMADDNLFLATPELMKFISEDKIKKLIVNNKDEVLEYIKHEIPMTDDYSFAALSINIEKEKKVSSFPMNAPSKIQPRELDYPSLNNLEELKYRESKNTESSNSAPDVLSPSPNIKPKTGISLAKIKLLGSKFLRKAQSVKKLGNKTNLKAGAQNIKRTGGGIKKLPKVLIYKFNELPKSSKLLLVLSVALAVLFGGSLIMLKQKKNEITKLSQHEILLNSALNKEKEAQDALIYKDKDKAKELLMQAKEEANKLIAADVMVAEAKNLLDKISEQIDKAEGVTRVKDPLLVADLKDQPIDGIFGLDGTVYSFNQSNNFVYSVDEESKALLKVSEESNNMGHFTKGTINDVSNSLIFLTDTPGFVEFMLGTRSIDKLEIDIFNYDNDTVDIKTYGDRLYRLVPSQKQILKHTRTIAGYSRGVEWVLSNAGELENAVSFAIDGQVYVLKSDGNIIKYLRGIKQEFNMPEMQNPLESPTKIYTSDNLDYLYVLEPKNKRVIVLDKNSGNLTNQYTSDKFDDLKDLYVDEEGQKLYILAEDNIYGIVLDTDSN